ncbi:undecaprenyl-phosphate glucose phosphotransferase [Thiomicrorhabdus sp.]|uniref:undecaprenyl-phosphate glucose phosphotransferase n=1 Tax=Thiomicrorhabdus sp. TaxID=2039724 RepID=UPI003569812D
MQQKVIRYDAKLNAIFRLFDSLVVFTLVLVIGDLFDDNWENKLSWNVILFIFIYNYFAESQHVYHSWRGGSLSEEVSSIVISWYASMVLVWLLGHFLMERRAAESYAFWLALGIVVPLVIVSFHIVVRLAIGFFRKRGMDARRVAVFGATALGKNFVETISDMPLSGFRFVGFYDDRKVDVENRREKLELVGGAERLIQDCKAGKLERVYITLSLQAEKRTKAIIKELADTTVSVYFVPDMFTFDLLHSKIEDYKGIPAISVYESPFSGMNAFLKRLEDIVLGSIILILISIPMLVIAIAIKRTSPGPIIFKQKRYGKEGKEIEVWKFRSMTVTENGDKVVQAKKNDSRITPLGAFLRRTSLDELPQFINVVQGRMSIVGPRPHAVAHNEEYRKQITGYMLRHKIKPGITGLAQINGFRGETDTLDKMEQRIHFDLVYIRKWSVLLDLKIIFLTLFKGFTDKNAY